jgi:hypothetical protein
VPLKPFSAFLLLNSSSRKSTLTAQISRLSEAINSMYSWYKASQVCYAFLADVQRGVPLSNGLRKSQWFTRGWTLQELLAPSSIVFFDKDWVDIGTKVSLEEIISEITGIDDFANFETACVAQKMSWAAKRETTRVEDKAYCLLGLFDVNMPPLYGEGEKAFTRLQLEILKTSDDESIFAWYEQVESIEGYFIRPPLTGLLASSPKQFQYSGGIRPIQTKDHHNGLNVGEDHPFSMTNKGLHISLPLIPDNIGKDMFIAPLKCSLIGEKAGWDFCPAICLQRKVVNGVERYGRLSIRTEGKLLRLKHDEIRQKIVERTVVHKYIYVKGDQVRYEAHLDPFSEWTAPSFTITAPSLQRHGFVDSQYESGVLSGDCTWDMSKPDEIGLVIRSFQGTVAGVLFVNVQSKESVVLAIVLQAGEQPCLLLVMPGTHPQLKELTASLNELFMSTTSHAIAPTSEDSKPITELINEAYSIERSDSEESMDEFFTSNPRTRPPLDRISRHLRNGKSVSASLRRVRTKRGGLRFMIDIGIDSGAELPWPAPSWAEKLLASVEGESKTTDPTSHIGDASRTVQPPHRVVPVASSPQAELGVQNKRE